MIARLIVPALLVSLSALAGCSSEPAMQQTPAQEVATQAIDAEQPAGKGDAPVAAPRIAYVYKLGYKLPGDAIPRAQQAQVALCDRLGGARCQVVGMRTSGGEAAYASGMLKLRVDSGIARAFIERLNQVVAGTGGRATETAIEAEDVSKQIVDAAARIRQRDLLVARLTEILRTRQGSVGDLVAAERAVAQAQEELDQARGWLNELNGRVAMSTIDVTYGAQAADSGSLGAQLRDTLAESGSLFVMGLRALLIFAIVVAPWAIVVVPVIWLVRRRRRAARAADQA